MTAAELASSPEATLFACTGTDGSARLSVDGDRLVLVTQAGGSSRTVTTDAGWTNLHFGRVVGQQGGHQTHVRLTDDTGEYILFEGLDGQLADRPGRTYAGLSAELRVGNASGLTVECTPASDVNRQVVSAVAAAAERASKPVPQDEPEGSPYDGWF